MIGAGRPHARDQDSDSRRLPCHPDGLSRGYSKTLTFPAVFGHGTETQRSMLEARAGLIDTDNAQCLRYRIAVRSHIRLLIAARERTHVPDEASLLACTYHAPYRAATLPS